jgi:hypothetical protein
VKFTFVYPGTTIPLVLLSRDTREKAAPKRAADLAPVFISAGGFDSNPLRVGSRLFAFRDRQREHTTVEQCIHLSGSLHNRPNLPFKMPIEGRSLKCRSLSSIQIFFSTDPQGDPAALQRPSPAFRVAPLKPESPCRWRGFQQSRFMNFEGGGFFACGELLPIWAK